MSDNKSYGGAITREQFLFYETRTVARLMSEGHSDEEIIEMVVEDNLFQNPTEKMLKNLATVCLKRMHTLDDMSMVNAIAYQPVDVAKQVCLYAMMRQYRLVWDFMIRVVGEKYRTMNYSFTALDMNTFFMELQNENEEVASWADSTIGKIKQVLKKLLVDNGYLDSTRSDRLNLVFLDSSLEQAIKNNNDDEALIAFNCQM